MTSTTHDVPTAEAGPAEVHEVHARAAKARPLVLAFPTRTLPLLAILAGFGLVVLAFTYATVHRRTPQELATNPSSVRAQYEITYWLSHGYFSTGGVLVRSGAGGVPTLYRSSTGGALVTQFLVQKIYSLFAGYPSWGLLALTNQLLSLATSALLGLLGFRLARRIGAPPLHALAMAMAVQLVHFTFPDNLMVYWEMSGRVTFLLAACVFLLIEERRIDDPSRKLLIAQAVSAFCVTFGEFVSGTMFLGAYVIASLLLGRSAPSVKRLLLVAVLPMLLALGVHRGQLAMATALNPEMPVSGSEFRFRSGLDGSPAYYVDHLDLAYGRDLARRNFDPKVSAHLFRWQWLFFAGTASLLAVLILAMRGRVPRIAVLSLLSLLGAYLLHAAVLSQAVVIHPYYYDVLLFTPLVLALFVIAPSLLQPMTAEGGVAVVAVVFLAVWVSMVQMRKYALTYPPAPPAATAPVPK